MKSQFIPNIIGFSYQNFVKPVCFRVSADTVHNNILSFGEFLGQTPATVISKLVFDKEYPALKQKICGIDFTSPIGLAAGFDYKANLFNILPTFGFGFETIGTITNLPCAGNPHPQLGRLPKSKSLWVNKGFKNPGVDQIIAKLKDQKFSFPVGISLGKTNIAEICTQKNAVVDIVSAFQKVEEAKLENSYFEINISCPNLVGNVEFYSPKNLRELLNALDGLKIKKPIFIKLPIDRTDKEMGKILDEVCKHQISALIIGNLQKNHQHPSLISSESDKFTKGNFSGKPTFEDSNRLIRFAHRNYNLPIIGCGGVFSAEDAFEKVSCGASLVQLITGLVFEGPQLVSQINFGLNEILQKKGFKHISEAVGTQTQI